MSFLDRLVAALLVAAASMLPAAPADAHSSAVYHEATWGNVTVPWRWTPSVADGWRPAILNGANAWNVIGTGFRFGTPTVHTANFDPHTNSFCTNTAFNFSSVHVGPVGEDGVADAFVCRNGTAINKFAISFAATGVTWHTGNDAPPVGAVDLTSSSAHEFGHATGFVGATSRGHFNDPNADPDPTDNATVCPSNYGRATMCTGAQSNTWRRTPEPHDIHTFAGSYATNQYCGITVYGGFRDKYVANGGSGGAFGCPTVEEYDVNDGGRREDFVNGNMTFHPTIGVFAVKNAIAERWRSLGATGWAFPMMDETLLPDGVGYHNHFRRLNSPNTCGQGNNRSIYWHPSTGAHAVEGAIRERWCALGWEGAVGYPSTSESVTTDAVGRYNHFLKIGQAATCSTNGNASIFFHPQLGAHLVKGGIRQRWCAISWERGIVGYPTTSETPTPVRTGAFNHFRKFTSTGAVQHDASIYWSPSTGAWEVYGSVRSTWAARGWEGGVLGFPKAARTNVSTGFQQLFEFGGIYSASQTGTLYSVWGPVHDRYRTEGGPTGWLGFPVTDLYTPATGAAGDRQADFQNGSIRYVAATGTTITCSPRC